MDNSSQPILQAMLMADSVYCDAATGKYIVSGVFNQLFFVEPPAEGVPPPSDINSLRRAGSPWVYLSLTELRSEKDLELRYVSLHDNSVLFGTKIKVACNDPLETVQMAIPLPMLPRLNNQESTYALELLCEGTILGQVRVRVRRQPR